MDAVFWGDSEGSFFNFETVSKNRRIQYPMLPDSLSAKIANSSKVRIQAKQNGEIRILSADIGLMLSKKHKNDASAIFVNQLLPTKAGRCTSNIVYTESSEGMLTEDQALRIRKLYDEYMCDYIVLDCNGIGLGVYDALARDLIDPETGEVYPALSCCNNPDMAERCVDKNADKVIWAVKGSAKFNSDCAFLLREGFRTGRIRLLATEYDGEENMKDLKGYGSLSPSDQVVFTMPYINTTLLISELINLRHEESGGLIKISEKSGMRKDRYSSLAYNYYVANQIENKINKKSRKIISNREEFLFRAPKIK